MDPILVWIKQEAEKETNILKIVLFGSRARNDHHDRSDYDIALMTNPNWESSNRANWILDLNENAPTLCGLDIVMIDSPGISESIQREGIVIYERK